MDTLDVLQKLFDEHQVPILEFQGKCHDCKKKVSVEIEMKDDGKMLVRGGALYTPDDTTIQQDKKFVKCDKCYKEDPMLSNFRECEIFSRVVGYLRPTRQWNKGKKAEFRARKNYKVGG